MTSAWLVYRMDGRKPKFLGLYRTKLAAECDVNRTGDDDWLIEETVFIGWGISDEAEEYSRAERVRWNGMGC